jgi:hypothetical protein
LSNRTLSPKGVYPTRKPRGTYRIRLAIAADDTQPIYRTLQIEWSGRWVDDPKLFFAKHLKVPEVDHP